MHQNYANLRYYETPANMKLFWWSPGVHFNESPLYIYIYTVNPDIFFVLWSAMKITTSFNNYLQQLLHHDLHTCNRARWCMKPCSQLRAIFIYANEHEITRVSCAFMFGQFTHRYSVNKFNVKKKRK